VIDVAKLAWSVVYPVECTGSAGTRPQRCKEGVRPALQGSHVVVVELAGENVALGIATARQLLAHVVCHAGTVVDGLNIALIRFPPRRL